MKYHCSICGNEISRKSSVTKKINSTSEDLICLSCVKEIDPISYLFILQSIERNLSEELKIKESQESSTKDKEKSSKVNNIVRIKSDKVPA